MNEQEFLKHITDCAAEIQKSISRTMPIKAGRIAKDLFQENFLKGGFVDGGIHEWQPSKRLGTKNDEGKVVGKAKGAKGEYKTLMSSRNNLFNSIEYRIDDSGVVIENRVPYAAVHNEGLRAGRGKGFTMPQRQFIGDSKELDEAIEDMIENELTKILKL